MMCKKRIEVKKSSKIVERELGQKRSSTFFGTPSENLGYVTADLFHGI